MSVVAALPHDTFLVSCPITHELRVQSLERRAPPRTNWGLAQAVRRRRRRRKRDTTGDGYAGCQAVGLLVQSLAPSRYLLLFIKSAMGRDFDGESRASLIRVDSGHQRLSVDDEEATAAVAAMEKLWKCEERLHAERHNWRERLNTLWGPEPPYKLQQEDAADWILGRVYYTWIGDLMFRAAREELSERDMPRPTRDSRAYNTGIVLSHVLQKQRFRRHIMDAYIGVEVRHRKDPTSVGELRWVGCAQQLRTPRQLYAGIEWRVPPAHRVKQGDADASRSPFNDGVVDGEHLFTTSSGNATATCERVGDITIASPLQHVKRELKGLADGMPATSRQHPTHMSAARALLSALGHHIYVQIPVRLLRDGSGLAVPVVLQYYIEYLQSGDPSWRDGLLLVVAFSLISLVKSAATSKATQLGSRSGYIFKNALLGILFEKCATVSSSALAHPEMNVGRIVNMVSSDSENAQTFPQMLLLAFSAPLQLAVALVLLYRLVNWCAFAGFGVLIVFMPLQGLLMRRYFASYTSLSQATDARLKATNEFFSGVRVAKFMSWEPSFICSIEEKRRTEIAALRSTQVLYVFISFITNAIPAFVIAVVFMLYHIMGHELTPAIVFPTISLLNIMQAPFIMFPIALSSLVRFVVSMRRITRFLECSDANAGLKEALNQFETEQENSSSAVMETVAAEFSHATISAYIPQKLPPCAKELRAARKRNKNTANDMEDNGTGDNANDRADSAGSTEYYELRPKELLHDVTLRIPKGKLTCVVGETGAGKSTLLESLLGCHEVTSGSVRALQDFAYVPQQAWIMNATLKENILFFSDMNEARFRRALRCTQLEGDMRLLVNGVDTEIGERGINLSGGQKSRVSLARAVYAARKIYLLDDPLAALDTHVGERVMHECILGELREATRLLATHQLHVLRHADHIVVLQDGGIVAFTGSYEEYVKYTATTSAPQAPGALSGPQDSSEAARNAEDKSDDDTAAKRDTAGQPPNPDGDADLESKKENAIASVMEKGKLMTEEEKAVGSVPMATYLRYAAACGGPWVCIPLFLLFVVTEFVLVSPSLWLSFWSTKRFAIPSNTYLLVYVGLVAASAVSSPLRNAFSYAALRMGSWKLHARLLRSVSVAPLSFFDTTPLGRLLNRFSKDLNGIDSDLPGSIIFLLQCVLSVISSIAVMAVTQYFVFIVLIPCALVYYRLMVFYNSANREVRRIANRSKSPIFSILGEMLSGRWTIAAYGKATAFFAEALQRVDTVYACSYTQVVCNCWLAVRIEMLSNVVLTSVALLGVLLVMLQFASADVGLLSLSLTMAMNISTLLTYVVNQSAAVEADMNSVERVLHYTTCIDHEDLLDDIEAAIKMQKSEKKRRKRRGRQEEGGRRATAHHSHDGNNSDNDDEAVTVAVPLISHDHNDDVHDRGVSPPVFAAGGGAALVAAGSVVFQNVTMRYRAGLPPVLRGLNFSIVPGKKVGIVGRTGSGKSSLLLTLMRVVEIDGGDIFIAGRPIRSYGLRALRQLFSMIPQDPLLFNGTVRSNLDPFNESSDTDLWEALRLVNMQERLAGEADGLQCRVEDGGTNFSVGQRQLLCMARALLLRRGCGFILMDEATANIDPTLDRQIQDIIRHTFAAHTVITIAHRLHTVATYDMILLMEEGRVVEVGSPYELVHRTESKFYQMLHLLGESALQEFVAAVQKA